MKKLFIIALLILLIGLKPINAESISPPNDSFAWTPDVYYHYLDDIDEIAEITYNFTGNLPAICNVTPELCQWAYNYRIIDTVTTDFSNIPAYVTTSAPIPIQEVFSYTIKFPNPDSEFYANQKQRLSDVGYVFINITDNLGYTLGSHMVILSPHSESWEDVGTGHREDGAVVLGKSAYINNPSGHMHDTSRVTVMSPYTSDMVRYHNFNVFHVRLPSDWVDPNIHYSIRLFDVNIPHFEYNMTLVEGDLSSPFIEGDGTISLLAFIEPVAFYFSNYQSSNPINFTSNPAYPAYREYPFPYLIAEPAPTHPNAGSLSGKPLPQGLYYYALLRYDDTGSTPDISYIAGESLFAVQPESQWTIGSMSLSSNNLIKNQNLLIGLNKHAPDFFSPTSFVTSQLYDSGTNTDFSAFVSDENINQSFVRKVTEDGTVTWTLRYWEDVFLLGVDSDELTYVFTESYTVTEVESGSTEERIYNFFIAFNLDNDLGALIIYFVGLVIIVGLLALKRAVQMIYLILIIAWTILVGLFGYLPIWATITIVVILMAVIIKMVVTNNA